jgi:pre-mRNA-splicing factor CDC5/CEF1
MEIDEED